MSSRRREEIEAKRAKLAELRKAKEERKKENDNKKSNSSTPGLGSREHEDERARVHKILTGLLGDASRRVDSTPGSSVPSTPAGGYASLAPGGPGYGNNGTRSASRLSDSGSERNTRHNTMVQAGDGPDRQATKYSDGMHESCLHFSEVLCPLHLFRISSTLNKSFLRCHKR
jgi:dynein intermediate chain